MWNALVKVGLVKVMLDEGALNHQAILAHFTRPGRTVNHARVLEGRNGRRHAEVLAASDRELRHFLSRWPEHDHATGLAPEDDELAAKAREALLHGIEGYNNPRAYFRPARPAARPSARASW